MERLILHSDLNNFYASVECLLEPSYASIPLAVAGDPERRHGVVVAKNAIARRAGVKTGDVIFEAKNKCPDLVIVPPHFDLYSEYSRRVSGIYSRFTPLVEPFGPDECWLDCTGCEKLFGPGVEIAEKILTAVKNETGLTVSVGVSFTKPFAKLCSDLAEPDGLFEASRADYKTKLYGLPVEKLVFVGRSTAEKLDKMNVHTIGELAATDETRLRRALGLPGVKLKEAAMGLDRELVRGYGENRKAESVGHGMTAARDVTNFDDMYTIICYLSDKIAARMLKNGFRGSGAYVDLRSTDLTHVSRRSHFDRPTFAAQDIADAAMRMSRELVGDRPFALRTITIGVFELSGYDDAVQLSLFGTDTDKREHLERAIESIRGKYGPAAVTRASSLGTDFIYDKTDDEDFLPFKR